MTLKRLQEKCKMILALYRNRGVEICDEFNDSRGDSQCATCAYSNYAHLVKEVAEATDE